MNKKQKIAKRRQLLHDADKLLCEALRLGGHHPCFGEAVVQAQGLILDALAWDEAAERHNLKC